MVIETTRFGLADGVEESDFVEFDEWIRTGFLYHQPGLVRATTAKSDDEWIVIVLWVSVEAADAAFEVGTSDGTVQRFTELVSGVDRKRYVTLD